MDLPHHHRPSHPSSSAPQRSIRYRQAEYGSSSPRFDSGFGGFGVPFDVDDIPFMVRLLSIIARMGPPRMWSAISLAASLLSKVVWGCTSDVSTSASGTLVRKLKATSAFIVCSNSTSPSTCCKLSPRHSRIAAFSGALRHSPSIPIGGGSLSTNRGSFTVAIFLSASGSNSDHTSVKVTMSEAETSSGLVSLSLEKFSRMTATMRLRKTKVPMRPKEMK
mmetsp:Transcript_9047/g.20237  ORF Transcript_9047/g.20237 Transcript_9047/m.20237 type:complete len:220 (-) Transcript_9047:642-1301(-)